MKIVIKKSWFIDIIRFFSLLCFFQSVSYDAADYVTILSLNYVQIRYVSIIVFIVLSLWSKKITLKFGLNNNNKIIYMVWWLFTISVIVSAIYNKYYVEVIDCIMIFVLYFLVFPKLDISKEFICKCLIVNGVIVAIRCLLYSEIKILHYRGIYVTANSLAIVIFASVLASTYMLIETKKRKEKIVLIILSIGFIFLMLCTTCRSTVLACAVFMGGLLINEICNRMETIKKNKLYEIVVIVIGIMIAVVVNWSAIETFLYSFIFKWGDVTSVDLTSKRTLMWREVVENAKILGNGSQYVHCHNSFLIYLDQYGIISFILFVLFFVLIICKMYSFNKKVSSNDSIFSFLVVLSVLTIGMFEEILGVFGKPIVIFMFFEIGSFLYRPMSRNV